MDGETFDELQYVAERNAQDAMNILEGMRAMGETGIALDASQEEDEADSVDHPAFTEPTHFGDLRGPESTEVLRF